MFAVWLSSHQWGEFGGARDMSPLPTCLTLSACRKTLPTRLPHHQRAIIVTAALQPLFLYKADMATFSLQTFGEPRSTEAPLRFTASAERVTLPPAVATRILLLHGNVAAWNPRSQTSEALSASSKCCVFGCRWEPRRPG